MKFGVTVSTMATEKRPATFGDGNAVGHLAGIKGLGFDGIDLFIKPMEEARMAELEAGLSDTGLEVSVIFPIIVYERGLSLSDPDPDGRMTAVDLWESQIDLAARLESHIVLGLERGKVGEEGDAGGYEDRLAESLSHLADRAGESGVTIAMEPIHRFLVDAFHRTEECLEFLEKYHLDSVGLLLDTFHMNIEERSIKKAVASAEGRIVHVHAVDNNRAVPGDAHFDFPEFIDALYGAGYDGYLSIETRPDPQPYESAATGLRYLQSIV